LQDVDQATFSAALRDKLGKQRVSIMLDNAVIAFFKKKAGERGYQTLINQTLHQAMYAEQMEATLHRVIREELHQAASLTPPPSPALVLNCTGCPARSRLGRSCPQFSCTHPATQADGHRNHIWLVCLREAALRTARADALPTDY